MKIKKINIGLTLIISVFMLGACGEEFLDRQPLDELSSGTFWQSEGDAELALTGVYNQDGSFRSADHISRMDVRISDNGILQKPSRDPMTTGDFSPSNVDYWNGSYAQIAKCNNFLENIGNVSMDENRKAEMIAEVRFMRAWEYANLLIWFEDVPLITNVLTMDEANSVQVNPKSEIVDFVLTEMDAAIPDLPATRPSNQHGRIVKGAAYAVKGRVLMNEERWAEAVTAYENVMDLDVHEIDPDYRSLFDGSNEQSSEIIFTSKYIENQYYHNLQLTERPNIDGGWSFSNPFKNLLDAYLVNDGQTIEESTKFDPENEFVSEDGEWYRDPRLYYTIYLPGISPIKDKIYQGHPDSVQNGDQVGENPGVTGYNTRKWVDEDYTGNLYEGGNDIPIIRYAEVLLSYLESKIKAGDNIDQALLDATINKVRGRDDVEMPDVTETDPDLLWPILKRERRIELAFEGLRLWDLIRWGEAYDKLGGKDFYGMRLTEDPQNYDGGYQIDENGYVFIFTVNFKEHYHPWPIPQDELDINPNLQQKENWAGK